MEKKELKSFNLWLKAHEINMLYLCGLIKFKNKHVLFYMLSVQM
jgi:hypothetical protein